MKRNILLTTLILLPKLALACEMSRALTETQFVIDPAQKKTFMESKVNNAQIEVGRCTIESKFLLINLNSLYFQEDTARIESVGGTLRQKNSNCSIQAEVPFQKVESESLAKDVSAKNTFLRQCVKLVINDLRGQKIQFHAKSQCQVRNMNPEGSAVETDGTGCLVAVNPATKLVMETRVNPDCLTSQFLNQNHIQAGDYESVVRLWPAVSDAGQIRLSQPIGARYVRHTLLPVEGFMPRAAKEEQNQPPYISAFSTNISPGNISIMSLGQKRVQIQPTFLVENISKDFCKDGNCARPSSFITPIAGMLKLVKLNPNGKKTQVGEWGHALKVPSNWSGLAEFKSENNMSGLSAGALEVDLEMKENEIYELGAIFYEPRTLLDELMATQNYMELDNNLTIGEETEESLPTLPKAGQLGRLEKLPKMPTVGLGYKGITDLADQMNMLRSWSQKYDRVCNSQNVNCMKLTGLDRPISTIKMKFKMGPNNTVIPLSVYKKSTVFGGYEKNVTKFAQKVCQ